MRFKRFWLRIIAIYRIITSSNFILIDGISIYLDANNNKIRRSRLLRRTRFNTEDDFYCMKQALMSNFDVKSIEDEQ